MSFDMNQIVENCKDVIKQQNLYKKSQNLSQNLSKSPPISPIKSPKKRKKRSPKKLLNSPVRPLITSTKPQIKRQKSIRKVFKLKKIGTKISKISNKTVKSVNKSKTSYTANESNPVFNIVNIKGSQTKSIPTPTNCDKILENEIINNICRIKNNLQSLSTCQKPIKRRRKKSVKKQQQTPPSLADLSDSITKNIQKYQQTPTPPPTPTPYQQPYQQPIRPKQHFGGNTVYIEKSLLDKPTIQGTLDGLYPFLTNNTSGLFQLLQKQFLDMLSRGSGSSGANSANSSNIVSNGMNPLAEAIAAANLTNKQQPPQQQPIQPQQQSKDFTPEIKEWFSQFKDLYNQVKTDLLNKQQPLQQPIQQPVYQQPPIQQPSIQPSITNNNTFSYPNVPNVPNNVPKIDCDEFINNLEKELNANGFMD